VTRYKIAQAAMGLADVTEELLRLIKPGKRAKREDMGIAANLAVAMENLRECSRSLRRRR
jgi:hypothetical protein